MQSEIKPWVQPTILVVSLGTLCCISFVLTGGVIPKNPTHALMFQTALLTVVLSASVVETHFTKPAEALVNALGAIVALISVFRTAPSIPTSILMVYLGLVLVCALLCLYRRDPRKRGSASTLAYRVCSELGRARVLFSIVFLFSVVFYIDKPDRMTVSLLVFWAVLLVIWPLRIPQLLSRLTRSKARPEDRIVGRVVRIDSPGIARVELYTDDEWRWDVSPPVVVSRPDGSTVWGIPLASENRGADRWGIVLLTDRTADVQFGEVGRVESVADGPALPTATALLQEATGIDTGVLVGFVQEDSDEVLIRVEAVPDADLTVGKLLSVGTPHGPVFFQVVSGRTREESFDDLRYGSHLVLATQVGQLNKDNVFEKYEWVPSMNAPVFAVGPLSPAPGPEGEDLFRLGSIPGGAFDLLGNFKEDLESHTAILGVTGSGKTEFAFDLIEHAVKAGVKVICIDLTAQYRTRLDGLQPVDLSLPKDQAEEFSQKLFAVETGEFKAQTEKRLLAQFIGQIEPVIKTKLKQFLARQSGALALIELTEISNSTATLRTTELYLSILLEIARTHSLNSKVLVVVEEAHTVMPELNFLGVGEYEARGIASKISQIALQGRKYGIGLLVIAQRTANVSKSVLTQCNTVISFSCIDDTSIGFLSNVYGRATAESLPKLRRLHAVAHGPWIRSTVPIAFEVEFVQEKADRKFQPQSPAAPTGPPVQHPPPAVAAVDEAPNFWDEPLAPDDAPDPWDQPPPF